MAYATSQAQLAIAGIITDVDPDKKASGKLDDILTGLTLGLAFLAGPEFAEVGQVVNAAAKALTVAIQNAPGAVKALWPEGTADTQTWQIGSLSDDLGNMDDEIRGRINAGLQLVETDVPTFLAFGKAGQFSSPTPPSLDKETTDLEAALKLYLVSTALDANAYQAGLVENEDQQSRGGKGIPGGANDGCLYYTNIGLCTGPSGVWHSNNSNADYTLEPSGGTTDSSQAITIIQDMFTKGYTTGNQLFDGAATCNGLWDSTTESWISGLADSEPYSRSAGAQLYSFSDTGFDFSCLSQLTIFKLGSAS